MKKEFEKVLDDIVTSKVVLDFAKRNVEDVSKRFNETLRALDVENLIIDEQLRHKMHLANDILQEYAGDEDIK